MKVHTYITTEVALTLNTAEAQWLHAVMQNPMVDNEGELDVEMRKRFFEATQVAVDAQPTRPL